MKFSLKRMSEARNLYKKHGGERIVRQEIFLKKNE
jgi:hypothetical protein